MLKHASNVPRSAAAFAKLMGDAGLPDGVFQNLYPTRTQIAMIIKDLRVCGVALTGSENAGGTGAAESAKALEKRLLKLAALMLLLCLMMLI